MNTESPRITGPVLKVLKILMNCPEVGISGAEIARSTKLASGTLYPILFRLENAGWLESRWEEVTPSVVKRPRKRLYHVTALGERRTKDSFRELMPSAAEFLWQS
ncbi:MAG: PadR family transcriptional regulator [Acidobacteriota bacterium]